MIKIILIAFLLLLFCWAIYLMQVDPEAEAFFYSSQDKGINNWLNYTPVKISFVGDAEPFYCWLNKERISKEKRDSCASNENLFNFISQNKILLDKYDLFKKDSEKSELLSDQSLIRAHQLFIANIYLMAFDGNSEKVLSLLVEDNNFWKKRFTEGAESQIRHAIYMVHLDLNFRLLPSLLNTDRKLTETEYVLLKSLLIPIPTKDLNVERTLRGAFELLKTTLPELRKEDNKTRSLFTGAFINHAYENTQEFLTDTKLPFSDLCTKRKSKKLRGQDNLVSFAKSFIKYGYTGFKANVFFETATSGHALALYLSLHGHNAKRKLLGFIVLLKEKNIPSSQIFAFIKDNPVLATNPLTGNLFKYDQEEKKISMDATECSEPWSILLSNLN